MLELYLSDKAMEYDVDAGSESSDSVDREDATPLQCGAKTALNKDLGESASSHGDNDRSGSNDVSSQNPNITTSASQSMF